MIPFLAQMPYSVFAFERGQLNSSEAMKGEQLMLWTIVVVLLVLFLIGVLH